MPRLTQKVPAYRKHAKGQAIVVLNYKTHYLGAYGSKASRMLYDRLIAEWLASDRRPKSEESQSLTLSEVVLAYWKHCKRHYRMPNGKPSSTQDNIKYLLKPLRKLYGDISVDDFGPLAFKTAIKSFIVGKSRRTGNMFISRIKAMFNWAVSEELIETEVAYRISTVKGLEKGRSEAKEPAPIEAVADAVVDATIKELPTMVADMVHVQRLIGARPAEIVSIRGLEIDRSQDTWFFTPTMHKTSHKGKLRSMAIGPKAKAILQKYVDAEPVGYLFKPAKSESDRRAEVHSERKVPLNYGNAPGRKWRAKGERKRTRKYSDHYDVAAYRRAIARAAKRAKVESWAPNQLRHAAAENIQQAFGIEAVKATLGHSSKAMSAHYAKQNRALNAKVMKKIG